VRSPTDLPPRPRRVSRLSRRFWVGIAVAVVLIGFLSLRSLAVLWTDQMWFSSQGLASVFSTLFLVKVGLGLTFGAIFFLVQWVNLLLTDRFGARDLTFDPEDEIVRRFQNVVRPYAGRIYAAIALVMGVIAGVNAIGQWQKFLLFTHRQPFHIKDALFHMDLGFYVFTLPFISFVVTWCLVSLFVILLVTTAFHYLNGGIRASSRRPRVAPRVKAHLSVIGAGIALMKAAGYLVARWELVNSTNGYAQGAGYTDVHARLPATTILLFLSLASAAILLVNVRSRGWSLPAVAVGLWIFVALVIGVLYPTILQTVKVSPAQSSLEVPYIERNIVATRAAFGLDHVDLATFAGSPTITAQQVKDATATLTNIRLWDPSAQIALTTVQRRQAIRSYYAFTNLGVDRYFVNGRLTPVLIGARQLNTANLPSPSWVNQHLQYTHGIGAAVVAANTADPSTGNPVFVIGDVPPSSSAGMPVLTQPSIYFGINDPGWVVADTKQPELDYQVNTGRNAGQPVESHYQGGGGVQVGSFLRRAALALRLGDFNFLISNQIQSNSRLLFALRGGGQRRGPVRPRRLHHDRPVPLQRERQLARHLDRRAAGELQLRPQRREGRRERLHRRDALLRGGPERPDHPGLPGGLPGDVPAAQLDAGGHRQPPALPRRPLLGAGGDPRALPHHLAVGLLQRLGPLGDLALRRRGHPEPVPRPDPDHRRPGQRPHHDPLADEPPALRWLAAGRGPPAAPRGAGLRAGGELLDRPGADRLHLGHRRPARLRPTTRLRDPAQPAAAQPGPGRLRDAAEPAGQLDHHLPRPARVQGPPG
jgi:hypothetical protein